MTKGWIGVDLDGTLAHYDGWKGEKHVGAPIKLMVDRVRAWLAEGKAVKIMTARVSARDQDELTIVRRAIEEWCMEHIGQALPITCVKDYAMIALYDDRAVQVKTNTGQLILDPEAAAHGGP